MTENLYKLVYGAMTALAVFACTPEENPEPGDTKNKLAVTPDTAIEFKAADNSDVVLTVETDATEWEVKASEDWILTTKADGKITVNVEENTAGARAGRITVGAGNADPVKITVTQAKAEEDKPYLTVTPSGDISFVSTGAEPVVLTVDTNVPEWNYEVQGSWLEAVQGDGTLTVTASDNTTANQRAGRITIKAEGVSSVRVNAAQEAFDPMAGKVSLYDANDGRTGSLEIANLNVIDFPLTVKLDQAMPSDVKVSLVYDAAYVDAYNVINGTSCLLFPEELVTIPENGEVTIPAGQTQVSVILKLNPDSMDLRNNVDFLIPVIVKPGAGLTAPSATSRVNYTIARKCRKEVRNVVYIDTKDTNPLNFLELRLEDGSMMADAVVLFSSNINWDGRNQEVILNNNGPTQDLLDNTETFLQPLRKAGIKVFLSLLGNHDGAGLANLSEYGAKEYAKTLANAVLKYKLDGVAYDDEYSSYGTLSGEWFEYASAANAARLIYETKEAMKRIVPWETYNMVYYLGNINSAMPRYNGIAPGEFVDLAVNDYIAGAATPMLGMTKSQCSGGSVELERGGGFDPGSAAGIKTKGYGWMMWFSYNPVRHPDNVKAFQRAALGLYDNMKLPDPKYVYKKYHMGSNDKGQFDTEKYPFSWTGGDL